jgi:hypothetical protein
MAKMPAIIHKALYRRYCNSLNYFYTKDINKILAKSQSRAYSDLKDSKYDVCEEDNFIRYIPIKKFKNKFNQLWKYHQFNIDQPRIFIKEIMPSVEYYFGGMRKL